MASTEREPKFVRYRKKKHLNIGIVVFGIIFVYLVAVVIRYFLSPGVAVYEVREGSIMKDSTYRGFAVRSETVIRSDADGYANYYVGEFSKVKKGARIYTLSEKALDFESTDSGATAEFSLADSGTQSLLLKIQAYNSGFDDSDYGETYVLKDDVLNAVSRMANNGRQDVLDSMIANGAPEDLSVKLSERDGIVVYSVDGMEEVTVESATLRQLRGSDYLAVRFSENQKVDSGDPVYKLVTDDAWSILVEISAETKNLLSDRTSVKINFKKDNQTMYADLTFPERFGGTVACLTFDDSMVRYASERYLDIEMILEDVSGLKIPESSKVRKLFYAVPKAFLTRNKDDEDGVLLLAAGSAAGTVGSFVPVDVYYEEEDFIYLDVNAFQRGDVLSNRESGELFAPDKTVSLDGVYCVNKGYAVFRPINILCESDGYYIVEEGNDYGLSDYDHIVSDGKSVSENDVVF